MTDLDSRIRRRLANWGQTPDTRVPDPEEAAAFIERVGVATHYPASPEVPSLFQAYVGDAGAPVESSWDSPAGQVYAWRWALGAREAAFYTSVVRKRPTWITWRLVPAILRLRGELRDLDEVYGAGELSADARRVARAVSESPGPLGTGELRARAGFPTGKEQRAAYLKAVEELETRLVLAKVFTGGEDESAMSHALVSRAYPDVFASGQRLAVAEAIDLLLRVYVPEAAYAAPGTLAKHLGVPEPELREGLDRLVAAGLARETVVEGIRGVCYAWDA